MNKCLLKTECCADEADGAFEIRKYFYQLFNAFHYLVCLLNTQSLNDPMRMFVYCLCCMHRKHVCVCVPLFHAQKRSHWFAQCSLVFHQHFCWLVQNIDSSGKYYSLCSCLIAFICLFSVFHGSDECLHFAETRQAPSQNWAVHVCARASFSYSIRCIYCNISMHTEQQQQNCKMNGWKKNDEKNNNNKSEREP